MLTFNLAKLSYTADLRPDHAIQQFDWTHVHDGLVAVFDTFRSGGTPSEYLRILRASQVLYNVPIEEMVRESQLLQQTRAQQGIAIKGEDLRIHGIYRRPLLALRWSSQDRGMVSRIQMKFASADEYQIALDHVRRLGLYMTESASSASRPQTSATTFPPADLPPIKARPGSAITATPSHQTHFRDAVVRPASAIPRRSELLSFPRPDSASSMYGVLSELPNIHENPLITHPLTTPVHDDSATPYRLSSSELPPQRELPFSRPDTPKSGVSDVAKPGSRPSSSLMGPPPLPPSRDGRPRPRSRAGSSHPELPPLPKPTPLSEIQNPFRATANSSGRPSSRGVGAASRPQSAKPSGKEKQSHISATGAFRPVTSDGISSGRSSFGITNNVGQSERVSEANVGSPPLSNLNCQSFPHVDDLDSPEVSLAEVDVYAKQPDEVRMDVLNRFLLKHLEDDSFLKLVEDVEMAWARIAPDHR